MRKTIIVILCFGVLLSCKKDQVPEPCNGISMSGDRALLVGTWRWYSTTVEEWFDIGSPIFHDYTPISQGFEYHFSVSSDGLYKGYRNNVLVHDFVLSEATFEDYVGPNTLDFASRLNCGDESLEFSMYGTVVSQDTIFTAKYPLNFVDDENHLRTHYNYFVKE